MNYKIVEYSDDLDLTEFYNTAKLKGHNNNSSREKLIGCLSNEREYQVWILYFKDRPIGSFASHTFDEMGENSYRIAARTCVIDYRVTSAREGSLAGKQEAFKCITTNQHITGQFFIPTCIKWAGAHNNLYLTSNDSGSKSQKRVHNIYFPMMEKSGQVERICNMMCRGDMQTIWKLNVKKFYEVLNSNHRWD
jgi:hypothetical protein